MTPLLKIYKYEFDGNRVSVDLPAGARPLSFQFQTSTRTFQLWIMLDTAARVKRARHFRYFVTGNEEIEGATDFIGTAQGFDGKFAAHCFEVNAP
jgi:hypothetical protein